MALSQDYGGSELPLCRGQLQLSKRVHRESDKLLYWLSQARKERELPFAADHFFGGAVINGSEQRINRNLFKIAVELGKLAHTIAAANEVDEDTLHELHAMCVDEVRHINGVINFESAMKFQNE